MSDIKIFVSHRIDQTAQTVDDPMFVNVRCGAIFDKRNSPGILGDDTGENISAKRQAYNELTVHYWAWKNIDADYYGLCHYRRFFSFSKTHLPGTDNWGLVHCNSITDKNLKRFGILESGMREEIQGCDVIVPEPVDFEKIGYRSNTAVLRDLKNAYNMQDVKILWDVLREKYPDYYEDAMEYMQGSRSWLYNCFIMKKTVFFAYSRWLFDILFEFEKRIDMRGYSEHMVREPAHLAERLLGIYIYHLKKHSDCVIREKQLVKFDSTDATDSHSVLKTTAKKTAMAVFKAFIPYGSKSYRFIKSKYFGLRGWPYDPRSDMPDIKPDNIFSRACKKIFPPSAYQMGKCYREIRREVQRNNDRTYLRALCWSNEIQATHRETFAPYKYCNMGKDVVLLATGPTLSFYTPIQGAKHIGVNGACKYDCVPLDYFFMQDCTSIGHTVELQDLINLNCEKFLGIYYDRYPNEPGGTEFIARTINAKRYIFFHVNHWSQIPFNIEFFPLMDYGSVTFAALNFALYTHPKRIFIVGCDASTQYGEHFNETRGADIIRTNMIVEGYKMLKRHIDAFFPEIEIIVVNPVGLKGIFNREVYTQAFLDMHPDVKERLGEYCTLLNEISEIEESGGSRVETIE